MLQVDLSTLSGRELRRLLDTTRERGQAAQSYQILQEMAARRDQGGRRPRLPMRRPERRIIDVDLGDPMDHAEDLLDEPPPPASPADLEPEPPQEPMDARPLRLDPEIAAYPRQEALSLPPVAKPPRRRWRGAGFAAGVALGAAMGWGAGQIATPPQSPPSPAPAPSVAAAPKPPTPAAPPSQAIVAAGFREAPAPAPAPAPEATAEAAAPAAEGEPERGPVILPPPPPPLPRLEAKPTKVVARAGAACAGATTPADRTICADPRLRQLQGALRQAYAEALEAHSDRALLRERQLAWRDARDPVSDPQRLSRLYQERIRKLKAATTAARSG